MKPDGAQPVLAGGGPVRLARYLASCGMASRRACEELIRSGDVLVNGTSVSTPAFTVVPGRDQVYCRGVPCVSRGAVYILANKPRGVTCSARDPHAGRLVGDLLPPGLGRLFTVGRLDRDSEGLILLTNDGELAQSLAHPSGGTRRTYEVEVRGRVDQAVTELLRRGVEDAGEFLRPLVVTVGRATADGGRLQFVLGTGRKREVRRLCHAVGLQVQTLVRTRFGPLRLGSLQPGEWRYLSESEVAALRAGSR